MTTTKQTTGTKMGTTDCFDCMDTGVTGWQRRCDCSVGKAESEKADRNWRAAVDLAALKRTVVEPSGRIVWSGGLWSQFVETNASLLASGLVRRESDEIGSPLVITEAGRKALARASEGR